VSSDRRNNFFYYATITVVPTSGDRRATWTFFARDRRRSFPLMFGTLCILTVRFKYLPHAYYLRYLQSMVIHDRDVPTQILWSDGLTIGFVFPLTLNLPTTVADRPGVRFAPRHTFDRQIRVIMVGYDFMSI